MAIDYAASKSVRWNTADFESYLTDAIWFDGQ